MTNFLFCLFCHGGKDIQTGGWDRGFEEGDIFLKQLLQMASVMEKSLLLGFATEIKILVLDLMVHKLQSRTRGRLS